MRKFTKAIKRGFRKFSYMTAKAKIIVSTVAFFSISAVTVAAVVSINSVDGTKSSYNAQAPIDIAVANADFNLSVTKLITPVSVTVTAGTLPATFETTTEVTESLTGTDTGTTKLKDGHSSFFTAQTITNFVPGGVFTFGYKCSNVGSVRMLATLDMLVTPGTPAGNYAKDSTGSYKFDIYESNTLNGIYTKLTVDSLFMSDFKTTAKPITVLSNPAPRTLNVSGNGVSEKFYIVVVHFVDGGSTWSGNYQGDNAFISSTTGVDFIIKVSQN